MKNPFLQASHTPDSPVSSSVAAPWHPESNFFSGFNSEVRDGTAEEEDFYGGDLTGCVLEAPNGLYFWEVILSASGALDAGDDMQGYIDHATDATELTAPSMIPGTYGAPILPFSRTYSLNQGMIWTRRPHNALICSLNPPNDADISAWAIKMMKVG